MGLLPRHQPLCKECALSCSDICFQMSCSGTTAVDGVIIMAMMRSVLGLRLTNNDLLMTVLSMIVVTLCWRSNTPL